MRKVALLVVTFALVLLSACANPFPSDRSSGPAYVNRTTNEGLIPLAGPEIESMFKGTAFQSHGGEWTWVFGARGKAHARAYDGAWEIKEQKWEVTGDKLCRQINENYPCVPIYAVDGVIRFGIEGSQDLERWAILPYSGDI